MAVEVIDKFEDGVRWVQPCHLVKMYSLSRTTIYRLTEQMKRINKYKNSIRTLSKVNVIVNLKDFDKYLAERSKANERA